MAELLPRENVPPAHSPVSRSLSPREPGDRYGPIPRRRTSTRSTQRVCQSSARDSRRVRVPWPPRGRHNSKKSVDPSQCQKSAGSITALLPLRYLSLLMFKILICIIKSSVPLTSLCSVPRPVHRSDAAAIIGQDLRWGQAVLHSCTAIRIPTLKRIRPPHRCKTQLNRLGLRYLQVPPEGTAFLYES